MYQQILIFVGWGRSENVSGQYWGEEGIGIENCIFKISGFQVSVEKMLEL